MRLYAVTRTTDGFCDTIIAGTSDEAFAISRAHAGLDSWTRDRVSVEDVGGTAEEHAAVDACAAVAGLRETYRAKARELAAQYVSDEDAPREAFARGAHRAGLGVMRFEVVTRLSLDDDMRSEVWEMPEAAGWSRGARDYAYMLIRDAAWLAFGDGIDRLFAAAPRPIRRPRRWRAQGGSVAQALGALLTVHHRPSRPAGRGAASAASRHARMIGAKITPRASARGGPRKTSAGWRCGFTASRPGDAR